MLVVPACGFAPEADGILARGLPGEIVGDVPAGCEIGWGVVGSDAAFVVAKDHVHDPVQGVLDGPVRADHRPDHSGQHHQRGDIEARLVCDLPVYFAPAFAPAATSPTPPLSSLRHPL